VTWATDAIQSAFDARDLGDAHVYLGMTIARDRDARKLTLSQQKMTKGLLATYGLADAKPLAVPINTSTKLAKAGGEPLDQDQCPYSRLTGSLLYLTNCTRPDIAQAVGVLSKFSSCATTLHWRAALNVLRYLSGTESFGLCFGGDNTQIMGFCDADYAGDTDDRRSTTGYVFTLNGGGVSWASRRRLTVAASTTEAEYMAAAAATKEALWLHTLMRDLRVPVDTVDIYADNQGAIKLLKNPITSMRSKHIDVVYHFAREHVERQDVAFQYISTQHTDADVLTRAVPTEKAASCRDGMDVCNAAVKRKNEE